MMAKWILLYLMAYMASGIAQADEKSSSVVAETVHKPGLMDLHVNHAKASVYLRLPAADDAGHHGRYIHAVFLTGGMGSNPVGLDRSAPRGSQIVHFRRAGGRVMLVAENSAYTASADNPHEKRAVANSFATSVIWSADIVEEAADGGLLINITSLLTSDMGGIAAQLKARGQGSYAVDSSRSFAHTKDALAFPRNLELDATLTFKLRDSAGRAGGEVRTTTPVPNSISLIAHHTFLALPEVGYKPRRYDHRMAMIPTTRVDMSAPLSGDVVRRFARRFRLQLDADGQVIKPIVFYVDNGAPEPIRSALLDGAGWWATAFEKAGFPGGFQVAILPDDVHPMDARYNVINWVHRATRGWSYGMTITDPRTGEVLRGMVILGSLRVRQDIKIFEALAGAAATGTGGADDPVQVALARLRQLSAHEVGHPLGFSHNMAASTYGGRASVMDYPAPMVRVDDGRVDFSKAYGVGVGVWDEYAVRALYGDYGGQSDSAAQAMLAAEAVAKGLVFVSDADSRAGDTGHPSGAVWDNGADPVAELAEVMAVRQLGLRKFGAAALRDDEPAFALQTKFVPLYLYHRYQLASAAKSIGGIEFHYRRGGDGRIAPKPVPVARQRAAVQAVAGALSVDALLIPEQALAALAPTGQALGDAQFNRESFARNTRPSFDEASAVEAAARAAVVALMAPARLERLAQQGGKMADHPGLGLLAPAIDRISARRSYPSDRQHMVADLVERVYADHLLALAADPDMSAPVGAWALEQLRALRKQLAKRGGRAKAHARYLMDRIKRGRTAGAAAFKPVRPMIPPGSPIGGGFDGWP